METKPREWGSKTRIIQTIGTIEISKRITAIDKYIYKKLSSQPLHNKYQIPKLNKNAYTHYCIKQKKYPKELESLNKKINIKHLESLNKNTHYTFGRTERRRRAEASPTISSVTIDELWASQSVSWASRSASLERHDLRAQSRDRRAQSVAIVELWASRSASSKRRRWASMAMVRELSVVVELQWRRFVSWALPLSFISDGGSFIDNGGFFPLGFFGPAWFFFFLTKMLGWKCFVDSWVEMFCG